MQGMWLWNFMDIIELILLWLQAENDEVDQELQKELEAAGQDTTFDVCSVHWRVVCLNDGDVWVLFFLRLSLPHDESLLSGDSLWLPWLEEVIALCFNWCRLTGLVQ